MLPTEYPTKEQWIAQRNVLVGLRICGTCGAQVPHGLTVEEEFFFKGYGDCPTCFSHYASEVRVVKDEE